MSAKAPDIPGFRIEGALGSGAQARVWRAIQESLQRRVALKVLRADLGLDADALLREAQLAGSLTHPHVVHIHDCGRHGDAVYIAQEWVDGVDAEQLRQQRGGRLPLAEALRVMRDAALGAAAIADAGLVHRDIKPANILVTLAGSAKIADLGCANRQIGGRTMTATGMVVGTPAYMSPEQARGEPDLDVRSDVYALGATLFTLAAGRPLITGDQALEVMTRIANAPLADPAAQAPWLPAGLAVLLRVTTAFERARRLPHPTLLAEDLNALIEGRPPANAIAFQRGQARRRRATPMVALTAVAAGGLAVGLAWGAIGLWRRPDPLLTEARTTGGLGLWRRILSHANGPLALEAERAIRLLEKEASLGLPVAPVAASPVEDDTTVLARRITVAESALAEAQKNLPTVQAEFRTQRDEVRPLPPRTPDVALLANRVTALRIPDLTSDDEVLAAGGHLVIAAKQSRISRDGGATWTLLPPVPWTAHDQPWKKLTGPMHADNDFLIARTSGKRWLRLKQGRWTAIPSPDGGSPDVLVSEDTGRLVAIQKEGRTYPGPVTVWTSSNDGASWTLAGKEPKYLAIIRGSQGVVVTAWAGAGKGTRIFHPGAKRFVPLDDGGRNFTWQYGFSLNQHYLLLPPDPTAWMRLGADGRARDNGPCDLRRLVLHDLIDLNGPKPRLYAWCDSFGIIRSHDGGSTWHASFGILASLGRSKGTLLRWGPRGDQVLLLSADRLLYVLDDSDASPDLFPSPFTWDEGE